MRKSMVVWALISLGISLGISAAGAQAASFSADGQAVMKSQSKSYEVAEGHTLLMSMSNQTVTTNDPQSPLNGVTGPCYGEINITAAGASGDGYCNWTDPGGDLHVISWAATAIDEDRQLSGAWKIEHGKGKWEGASGSGSWHFTTTGEGAAAVTVNNLTGTITLK